MTTSTRPPTRPSIVVSAVLGVTALLLALLVGVVETGTDGEPGAWTGAPSTTAEASGASALDDPRDPALPEPLIDVDDLVSGGPPPDGIPPIDEPVFLPASEVDWLAATDPVLSLTVGRETRGYPLEVMTWHEIVNDTVAGTPVAVTYCPLCNSGVAFERRVGARVLRLGTSGMLYADNLVMYDRETESLWPQLTGIASVGTLTGTELEALPMGVVGWRRFRAAHPDAPVLTRETGVERDYGRNPYVGYDRPDGELLVEPPGGTDPRLPAKERVVGIRVGEEALAVRREEVADAGVVEVSVGGRDLVVWHVPGQASALDTESIAEGEEIGSVAVFWPRVGGRDLTFRRSSPRDGGDLVDAETGSRWNALGEAVTGPLTGERLVAQTHLDTFWFAWVAFRPETRLE